MEFSDRSRSAERWVRLRLPRRSFMSISGPDAITRMGLEEVVRQMPAAVMVVEATSGRFIHVNEAAREMTERHLGRIIPGELTADWQRSEEHTSELQSRSDLVCRLLLEKKKQSPGHCRQA